jgi:hypothetical protein
MKNCWWKIGLNDALHIPFVPSPLYVAFSAPNSLVCPVLP